MMAAEAFECAPLERGCDPGAENTQVFFYSLFIILKSDFELTMLLDGRTNMTISLPRF